MCWRLKGDQTEVLKISIGFENIDRNVFSLKEARRTRGHEVTPVHEQCRKHIRNVISFTKNSK